MAIELKFLHASDLHLDEPISGLPEIPAHLKKVLANAPYVAAERLFDRAIAEKVDFVLLAGDVVNLDHGGPRSAAFLLAQFERLLEKGIRVYWCGGSVDQPDRWPAAISLPENLLVFPSTMIEHAVHQRNGRAIATICGAGHESRKRNPADFRCESDAPFPVALLHGELDTTTMTGQNIRYWALGGRHRQTTIDKTGSLAVFSGTTQSRCPEESGACGCMMATVDDAGRVKVSEIEIDVVRWSSQKITVAENASLENLKSALAERCSKIRLDAADRLMLVQWTVSATGEFNPRLRNAALQAELLAWLRTEYGMTGHGIWTTRLQFDPPESLPADWYEEDTILGDYLRATSRYQGDSSMAFSLADYLPTAGIDEEARVELSRVSPQRREQLLQRMVLAGIEYLSPREIES